MKSDIDGKEEGLFMSSPVSLIEHYNTKYHAEVWQESTITISSDRAPQDRFHACLKYFPEYFHEGDILELGAGSGLVARSLIRSGLNLSSYTLSDFSRSRLEGLQKNFDDARVRILELDADNIPENQVIKYDAVIMIALIEHLIDPLRALRKIRNLLAPGGIVYIDTPNIAKFTRRTKLLMGRFPSTASQNEGLVTYDGWPVDLYDEGHLHYFTYRSLSNMLLQHCGFSKVKKLGYYCGRHLFGPKLDDALARSWPELFSELVMVAYA
jgi:2-polyprenyl-3-methyl-5-hydroxy-6-metoxy-1,4-benzoquinol methylase